MTDPVAHFRAVAAEHARCFWLDGGGARDWSGRRSVIGWLEEADVSLSYDASTRLVTRHAGGRAEVVGDDVFAVLAAELAAGPDDASWFGYLGYACRPDLPARTGSGLPDAVWMRPSHVRVFEHEAGRVVGPGLGAGVDRGPAAGVGQHLDGQNCGWTGEVSPVHPQFPRSTGETAARYPAAFARVQEHLHAGDTYEVNLTHRESVVSELDPATAYLRLRELNPAPYAGFVQHDVPGARSWLLSSSPERYAVIGADRTLETKPIKGTTSRGATAAEDAEAAERLRTDPKFRAENLMIVDLLRNDLSMVCAPGTVTVPALMEVESYPSVHQLVSTVRGRLRDGVSTVDALRALFPAGSMTGAPKLRTMQIIEQVEETPRGPYAGAFGWIGADGRADLGVVIRSLATAGDGRYLLGTGGGITVRSDVAEEWAEAQWKAERLFQVFNSG